MSAQDPTIPDDFRESTEYPGYGFTPDSRFWSCLTPGKRSGRNRGQWHQLRGIKNRQGYLKGSVIDRSGRRHNIFLHRMILEAFVGPCPEGMECLHLDNNKTNNAISNLRWGSHQQNMDDASRDGVLHNRNHYSGTGHPFAKLKEEDIPTIMHLSRIGWSDSMIASRYGISREGIRRVRNGKGWKHVPR
jgi:hypothetical protein